VDKVEVVEDDQRAFERVRPYLPADTAQALADPRMGLVFQDGRRFVNRLPADERFDLVLVLGASPSSAYSNRYFTEDCYRQPA
jgi:spermidine synthase